MLKAAIFLDRDGVINKNDGEHILHWDQFEFLPGVMEAMFLMYASKYEVFVVSNQSGIAMEMVYAEKVVTQVDIHNIFTRMEQSIISEINSRLLCNAGVPGEPQLALSPSDGKSRANMSVHRVIRDISFCPHAPDAGCCCRKPKPGMIYAQAYKHGIDLSKSWMIGDQVSDIKAGYNAGIRRLIRIDNSSISGEPQIASVEPYVPGSMSWSKYSITLSSAPVFPDLLNAVNYISARDKWEEEHVR